MLNYIRDIGSKAYTGLDRLVGGVLPGGQDISQGYIADIGRSIGLPVSSGVPGGVASIQDTKSIAPVIDSAEPTNEQSLQNFFSSPQESSGMGLQEAFSTPIDTGTQGLFEVFGDGGGGFIPPGYNSEAEMVAAGIGDGWTPTTYYEFTHNDPTGSGSIGVTDLENGRYKIDMVNATTGRMETFIQAGLDGKGEITNYDNNFTATGEMAGSSGLPRTSGVDVSSLFATAAVDPNSTLELGTMIGGKPMDMERIDSLDSATLVKLNPLNIASGGGGASAESEAFSQKVIDNMVLLDQAGVGTTIESNPIINNIRNGMSLDEALGVKLNNTDPVVSGGDITNTITTTTPGAGSLAQAFASGGLADGNQTPEMDKISGVDNTQGSLNTNTNSEGNRENPMNTPGNPISQGDSGLADGVSKNVATGLFTQTGADGSETEGVYDEGLLSGAYGEQQGPSIEKFHDYMETKAFYDSLKAQPNESGDTPSLELWDISAPNVLDDLKKDYIEIGKNIGLSQDEINRLKGANTWDALKKSFSDVTKPFNVSATLKGAIDFAKGVIRIPKNLGKVDEARQVHNINIAEQRAVREVLDSQLEQQRNLDSNITTVADLDLSGYGLQMALQDAINNSSDAGEVSELTEALVELKAADTFGMDINLTDDDDFSLDLKRKDDESGYTTQDEQDEYGNLVSSPSSLIGGKLDTYENPFNPSEDPFKQPYFAEGAENEAGWDVSVGGENQYADDTTRETGTYGVMNDGKEVAQWNPFAKESAQEKVAKDIVNPNRSVSDGYSSPTMATIDRNIRPTLDTVGDIVEYPFEALGLGMYNTIGQLPLVGGAGKSIGNALARAGQGIDRAIDTKMPDGIFGLDTGGDGEGDDDKISREMMDQLREWGTIYGPGDSPLVELMRDKRFGRSGSSGGGLSGYDASGLLNSTSDPSMSILGGSGAPGLASTGGSSSGGSTSGRSGSGLDRMSSMLDGFDLSTPDGQAKYAELYGEDALQKALSDRGLFDRRQGSADVESAENQSTYAGIDNSNYRLKQHFEKPQQNIGEEIAKGINKVQEKEGVFA
jgi:hypothetical protein